MQNDYTIAIQGSRYMCGGGEGRAGGGGVHAGDTPMFTNVLKAKHRGSGPSRSTVENL